MLRYGAVVIWGIWGKWTTPTAIWFIILIISTSGASNAQLLCSQCSSLPDGDCVTSAPAPTACERTADGSQGVNCMTARQLDRNGTLVRYTRGCTMVRVGTGCVPQRDNTTLCYTTCHMNNCNVATTVRGAMVTILPLIISYMFLCL